jgi:P-type Cu+ transporter
MDTRHTAFLISNIHCSSCIRSIEEALYRLDPPPLGVSHSIVQNTVTVTHSVSLAIETIAHTLEEEGYDVYSIIKEPLSDYPAVTDDPRLGLPQRRKTVTAAQGLRRFTSSRSLATEQRRREQHEKHCEQCRLEHKADQEALPHSHGPLQGETEATDDSAKLEDFVVLHPASSIKSYIAVIAIEGMTCSSCVNTVSEALKSKPWVQSVDVNLLTNSASVAFTGENHVEELVETINDIGYDATLDRVSEVASTSQPQQTTQTRAWKVSLAIIGMTCSSCVGNITTALKDLPFVTDVNVNLISNSAQVVFLDRDHLSEIQTAIEDVGYDVTVNEVTEISKGSRQPNAQRTILIQVNGMYCKHCPMKVEEALGTLGEDVVIEKLPTTKDSVLKLSYKPQSPKFTIRTILEAISNADPAFQPTIYHPMTIEERSRRIRAREQRHILYRFILSVIIAIPTFILGIVYMDLVSSNNSTRKYLSQRLAGVTRTEWALFVLATPVYFFAADIFHRRTIKEVRALWRPGSPTPILRRFYRFGSMNMLVSLGTTIAYVASIIEMGVGSPQGKRDEQMGNNDMSSSDQQSYFDSVVFLTMFLLVGRLIEAYSKARTGDAVDMLGKLRPTEALLIVREFDNSTEVDTHAESSDSLQKVGVDLLEVGDEVKVVHGASPPCDGDIVSGTTSRFNESSLTGEARLVSKALGDEVYAGTVNQGDSVTIRVTGVGGASMLDQIMKVVREGQTRRAPIEHIADSITGYFVPFVVSVAIITWFIWLALGLSGTLPESWRDTNVGGWPFWSLQFAIAVFVIACPCGIGLAAPTALFVGGGLAAKYGILVKGGGEAFEEASKLDCIVFDKTGTLTEGGDPVITDYEFRSIEEKDALDEKRILSLVEKVEQESSHPIAKAVVDFCKGKSEIHGQEVKSTTEIAGKGMKGSFSITSMPGMIVEILVGNEPLMTDYKVPIPEDFAKALETWKREAKSVVLASARTVSGESQIARSSGWSLQAIFSVSDPLRQEAPGVVQALQRHGIDVWMISGDNPTTAHAVGEKVGIPPDNIIAGVLPEQKAEKIKYLQSTFIDKDEKSGWFRRQHAQRRRIVAMVGDGINDSPALTMADVGIAIGSGSDVAISAAKVVLLRSELTSIITLTQLSRVVFRRIKFNFLWALIYNMAALPVAAGVLYPIVSGGHHIRLDPVWAALAMALSSVSVVCSSLLLRSRLPLIGFRD